MRLVIDLKQYFSTTLNYVFLFAIRNVIIVLSCR